MMTRRELARDLDVPEQTVHRWCSGKTQPQKSNVRRLAEALGIEDPFWFYEEAAA